MKGFGYLLKQIDQGRDRALGFLIVRYWPRAVKPNYLSALKIATALACGAILWLNRNARFWLFFFFILTLLLDLLDGSVARNLDMKTRLGAFLDPIGDKLLILFVALFSLLQNYPWLLVALFLPEIISIIGAIYFHKNKLPTESNIYGNFKIVLQSLVFLAVLIYWPRPIGSWLIVGLWLSVGLAFISLFYRLLGFQRE